MKKKELDYLIEKMNLILVHVTIPKNPKSSNP